MSAWSTPFLAFIRFRPVVAGSIALTLALGLANYFLWHQRRTAVVQHGEVRRKGEQMLRAITNRARIDADLTALQAAIGHLQRHLLDEQSMEVNLGYFYKLEKPARVRLVRLNQLAAPPPAAQSIFKVVPFSMQVTGPYRNTLGFLRALETGPRVLRIRHCSFERNAHDSAELVLDLTIEILAKP